MNIQQMNISTGPPQFIRATRPQWQGNQPLPQRQLIHLDAQTHAHVQSLDPGARAEYLSKLQKRNMLVRQQVDNKSLPTSTFTSYLPLKSHYNSIHGDYTNYRVLISDFIQQNNLVGGQIRSPGQNIIVRGQLPAGQVQWIQQQQVCVGVNGVCGRSS